MALEFVRSISFFDFIWFCLIICYRVKFGSMMSTAIIIDSIQC